MQIELTPEQDALVNEAVAKGLYRSPAEAVQSALNDWVEHERTRFELLAALEEGERSIEEDGGIILETEKDIQNFFDEIVENGKARLAAAQKADLCA